MRYIEAKARRQERIMFEAARWLDEPPCWATYRRLSVPECYPYRWSVWRRRVVKKKALWRAWMERMKNEVSS